MKKLCLGILLLIGHQLASQPIWPIGAKAWGMGGAAVADESVFSTQNNPAAITYVKKIQAGLYAEDRFRTSNTRLASFSMIVPTRWCHIGGIINHFGYSAFNQQKFSLGLAKKLSETFSLGVNLSYVRTNIAEQEGAGNPLLEAAVMFKPVRKVALALFIFNPTQSRYSGNSTDFIPTFVRAGLSYHVNKQVQVLVEADKAHGQDVLFRSGINYKVLSNLSLRAGASNNPVYVTFGFGTAFRNIGLDFSVSVHDVLGYSPHLSFILPFADKQ